MPKAKNNSATIGFWIVLGSSKEHPLIVCPALIRNQAVEKIESVSIKEAWNVSVQAPTDASEKAIMFMIPEVINITNLEKKVDEYPNLWEIQAVKAKCESLATKYINQFREANK
jgi:hypothetical protein